MRKIFIVTFLVTILFADSYDSTLISLHSKIYHKIILLDKEVEQKRVDEKVAIYILHNKLQLFDAKKFKNMIEGFIQIKYPYEAKIELIEYKDISKVKNATSLFLLNSSEDDIIQAAKKGEELGVLTYSFNSDYLKHGVVVSLSIGSSVKPYINLSAVKNNKIIFNPIIFKISKGYK